MFEFVRSRLGTRGRERFDARAAVELSRLGVPFMPWPRSALAPSALLTILNDVIINGRKTVVELGAGISTVYLGKVLEASGGCLISIESNPDWAAVVRRLLTNAGINDAVRIACAPLEISPHCLDKGPWYSHDAVLRAVSGRCIDALIVDGPPAYKRGSHLARFPAVPVLKDYLADCCAIFLDDIDRAGERRVARAWSKMLDIQFIKTRCGLSVAQRGPAFYFFF